jgi:Cd2+/Zn2+-exporting ATPase
MSSHTHTDHDEHHNHGEHHDHHHHHHDHNESFVQICKPIIVISALFCVAFIIDLYSKNIGFFAFSVVTLIGLYPAFQKIKQYLKIKYIFSIELLLSIACIGAILIHAATEAAAVIILFMIGEALESYSTKKARNGIEALASLIPEQATLVLKDGSTKIISVSEIQIDQHIEIKPGSRFPVDGIVVQGTSYVDESLLTGEVIPIQKAIGNLIVAGSICLDGALIVKASDTKKENTVSRIIKMVEKAQESKSPTMRTIEKFSRYYTPSVIGFSFCIAVFPPLFHAGSWHEWVYKALTILLIGCPCALIISTPSAIACGITAASRLGILIKSAYSIETLGKVKTIAFDKTGTLTSGKLKVTDIVSLSDLDEEKILSLAASVEEKSNHPLAQSIVLSAKERNISFVQATLAKTIPGKAAHALVDQKAVYVCSPAYAAEEFNLSTEHLSQIKSLQNAGKTTCVIVCDGNIVGLIALADKLKEDAAESINKLQMMGINCVILTGDNALSTKALTQNLHVHVESDLLPDQKWDYIKKRTHKEKVAMVGDGINDAPALTAAHVGIAMGSGTDIALDSAQITITRNQVHSLVDAIGISKLTLLNIKQNITIAVSLKLMFLILTLFGDTSLWMAILADTGATILVTLNAIRLLR